jgi:lipoyl(octanoyl) transferase
MHVEDELLSNAGWRIVWLGRVPYAPMLARQEALVQAKIREPGRTPDTLFLLEHEPVYTIGRTPDRSSLAASGTALPYPVETIHRGGQATYHGPGQLVGYPVLDLNRRVHDLHRYLRALEEVLIQTLAVYGVEGCRKEKLTGVWVGERKIASIGVGVRRWVTLHGFALNVLGGGALSPFAAITPCGLQGVEMTALGNHASQTPTVHSAATVVAEIFPGILDELLPADAAAMSQAPGQQQDDQDDQHQPQSAARRVAPGAAMGPRRKRT